MTTTSTLHITPKALVLGVLCIVVVAAAGWAATRWWQYQQLEPLRNGVSALKEGDYEKARSLIEPFARQAEPVASQLMGRMYAFGLGVPTDPIRAQSWYRIAECRCLEPGENEFGTAVDLARGFAGRKDPQAASAWLQRAAEAGNQSAQRLLSDPAKAQAEGFDVPEEVSRYWQAVPTPDDSATPRA